MVTALQILLILALISLIGIILGYLFGKLSCKKGNDSKIVEKGTICEESYNDNLLKNRQENSNSLDSDTSEKSSVNLKEPNAQTLLSQEDSAANDSSDNYNKASSEDNLQDVSTNAKELEISDSNTKNKTSSEDSLANTQSKQEEPAESSNLAQESQSKDATQQNTQNSNTKSIDTQSDTQEASNSSKQDEALDTNNNSKPQSLLSQARDGKADNLCRIKGVGAVIEKKLNNLGIYHFDQIANFSENEIAWVDEHLAFKGRIKREDWVNQAKLLAKGEETEFSKRVDKGEVSSSKKS
jgi:predicted flap endonuclease-1-like 5' DNA nuclease